MATGRTGSFRSLPTTGTGDRSAVGGLDTTDVRSAVGDVARETRWLEPEEPCCPDCGGTLNLLGEDVSATLEYEPAVFKVMRTMRPKLSCRRYAHLARDSVH